MRPGKVLLALALLLFLTACGSADLVITAAPPSVYATALTPSPDALQVAIDGAVARSGNYTLPPGSRVTDALQAAGGPADDADLARINLAVLLKDGQQVHVPRVGEVLPTPTPYGLGAGGRIDINLADVPLLETLPKIGPTTAQRIVDYRELWGPFESVEQIQEVKGIGPSTLEAIRDWITVGD